MSHDILVNLFKASEVVPDQIFNNWLKRKKELQRRVARDPRFIDARCPK